MITIDTAWIDMNTVMRAQPPPEAVLHEGSAGCRNVVATGEPRCGCLR